MYICFYFSLQTPYILCGYILIDYLSFHSCVLYHSDGIFILLCSILVIVVIVSRILFVLY